MIRSSNNLSAGFQVEKKQFYRTSKTIRYLRHTINSPLLLFSQKLSAIHWFNSRVAHLMMISAHRALDNKGNHHEDAFSLAGAELSPADRDI